MSELPTKTLDILLVDDEPGIRETFEDQFMSPYMKKTFDLDVRFTLAANGGEAIEKYRATIQEGHFDGVITDLNMPTMDGAQLFRHLRGLDPQIPIYFMISDPTDPRYRDILREFGDKGPKGTLIKPIRLEDLGSLLKGLAQLKAQSGNNHIYQQPQSYQS